MRYRAGAKVPPREVRTVTEKWVALPDPNRVVHLQFRRYAGCPICNVHLRSFANRHDEILAAGVHEVMIFHSTTADLAKYQSDWPFDLVPDPQRALYQEFGVERAPRAILHPSALWATVRGLTTSPRLRSGPGGHLGLPADFLLAPDGTVIASKYGKHANDHWEVEEMLRLVSAS